MIFIYFVILAIAVFGIGISGVAASKHFLIMMLSIEVSIAASALLALAAFSYTTSGNIVTLLFSFWAVASLEVMAIIVVYRYMVREEISLDVSKLSKLKN